MSDSATVSTWSGIIRRAEIPLARDPFVNTPLIALGPDKNGRDRFWISSYNAAVGCLGVLINEDGEHRIYRFNHFRYAGFYSAVLEDENTLWLCGNLAYVVRLDLTTGDFEEFETGAPSALVFQGMCLDPDTGKLFAAAYPPPETVGFSFSVRDKKGVSVRRNISPEHYMRFSFPNGDGTWTFVLQCPGESLIIWDPATDRIEPLPLQEKLDMHKTSDGSSNRLIADENGRRYFPGRGWFNPQKRAFDPDGPRPEREATWFARQDRMAYGVTNEGGADGTVWRWDLDTGRTSAVCRIPDLRSNVNISRSGKLVAVNLYGEFYQFDLQSGVLEMSRRLPTDSIQSIDCLHPIDSDRLLGTPFITQRFWEVNLKTGKGMDCGRAAPGGGEVLQTWKINGRIYMAAYTGAELVEYDPTEHPHFPENPRVVAKPPHAMRPVAKADDGRRIFYACSSPYGTLGSTLTAYDTASGRAMYRQNPLPELQIRQLIFDPARNVLLVGSSCQADCQSCAPAKSRAEMARINADTLQVEQVWQAPEGVLNIEVHGPLDEQNWLCNCVLPENSPNPGSYAVWFPFAFSADQPDFPDPRTMHPLPECQRILYTGTPGYFLLQAGPRLEVHHLPTNRMVLLLDDDIHICHVEIHGDSVYLTRKAKEINVLEHCLDPKNFQEK